MKYLLISLIMTLSTTAFAQLQVPYIFSPGNNIFADQVNQNFEKSMKHEVQIIESRYQTEGNAVTTGGTHPFDITDTRGNLSGFSVDMAQDKITLSPGKYFLDGTGTIIMNGINGSCWLTNETTSTNTLGHHTQGGGDSSLCYIKDFIEITSTSIFSINYFSEITQIQDVNQFDAFPYTLMLNISIQRLE